MRLAATLRPKPTLAYGEAKSATCRLPATQEEMVLNGSILILRTGAPDPEQSIIALGGGAAWHQGVEVASMQACSATK